MAATAADRLSALPDDLLQHILSFAPEREAAASAVLSCRWRPLWRETSAVNQDIRPYMAAAKGQGLSISPSPLDSLFRDAFAALAAFPRGGTVLKRLTLFLDLNDVDSLYDSVDDAEPVDDRRVAGLLADPAAAGLEEVLIGCEYGRIWTTTYGLPLASMACAATLRVLELESCNFQPPLPPSLAFPCLTELRLRRCFFAEGCLEAMVDAAPALTSLSLDRISQKPPDSVKKPFEAMPTYLWLPFRLRCLTATTLELETYSVGAEEEELAHIGIELDMPTLRSFRYRGMPSSCRWHRRRRVC